MVIGWSRYIWVNPLHRGPQKKAQSFTKVYLGVTSCLLRVLSGLDFILFPLTINE